MAWRTSRLLPKGLAWGCDGDDDSGSGAALPFTVPVRELVGGLEAETEVVGSSESPRSMKTSQTRSWAGKGIE